MGCTCDQERSGITCLFCRAAGVAPQNKVCCCYSPACEECGEIADQIYRLQHPARICTGCGKDENHSIPTTCQTCLARYLQIIHNYIGKTMTLWTHDMNVMIYGELKYHLPTHYIDLPEYLRPMCVDNFGHAYIQFKPTQIVNVHTYITPSGDTAIMLVVKL